MLVYLVNSYTMTNIWENSVRGENNVFWPTFSKISDTDLLDPLQWTWSTPACYDSRRSCTLKLLTLQHPGSERKTTGHSKHMKISNIIQCPNSSNKTEHSKVSLTCQNGIQLWIHAWITPLMMFEPSPSHLWKYFHRAQWRHASLAWKVSVNLIKLTR